MKFGTITRGDRKIYILLMTICPEGGRVVAESRVRGSHAIPAIVSEKDASKGEYVLILPVLYIDQDVVVRVLDSDGNIVDTAKRRIGHISSALSSKCNMFSKNPVVSSIRNFDRHARRDVSGIEVERICLSGYEKDESELVQFMVVTHCDDPRTYDTPFSVSVFDRRGKDMEIKNLTVLSDRVDHPVPHSDFSRRIISMSFRKARRQDWFFIWVRFEDDALPPALAGLDEVRSEDIRSRFERVYHESAAGERYEDWFYKTQRKSPAELDAQRTVRFAIEPKFSIIVPLYKTPVRFFEEMCASALGQTYANLELILVNSTPEDTELGKAVASCANADERVRVITLDRNLGIAGNTNEGIKVATGEFLCFFDHDDVLELGALFEYVEALNRYPETDLFYCDEDKLADGHLYDGFLKPDFSWEYLTANNYICHLLTVRKSVVDTVELSPDELSGVQDWDMTMKVAEKARNVFHVRKVLYHWRAHGQSAASSSDAKSYTHVAGELALLNHFARIGVPAHVHDGFSENSHRVEYILPDQEVAVSIVIPNKDHASMLEHCLNSIWEKSVYCNYEIVVIENNSTEPETFELYDRLQAEHDNLKVVCYEGSFNYSAINNMGVTHANGEYLLFLNNDMEIITPNWIELLLGPMQRKDVAITGARLLFPDGTVQHAGVVIPGSGPMHVGYTTPRDALGYFGTTQYARDVLAVTGACLMISRKDFDSVGGFDETLAVNYNDVDLCLRLREKGKSVVVVPYAELYHFESVSRGFLVVPENKLRLSKELAQLQSRWSRYFAEGDPFYGVNIEYDSAYYALDWNVHS